jgi:hypothetical protein
MLPHIMLSVRLAKPGIPSLGTIGDAALFITNPF